VKVGQQAPDFTLRYLARGPGDKYEQKTVSLADFKGKKTVILAFFPAAFSPG
jgi:peroxiredoxin